MSVENASQFIKLVSAQPECKALFGTFTIEELKMAAEELSEVSTATDSADCSYNLCGG